MIDFIHVGDYKTGTSWLQQNVFPFHPEIQYLGDPFENHELQTVIRELVDCRDLDFDADQLSLRFKKNFTKDLTKITGISREALSQSHYITGEHAKRNAQRLKAVFGNVKIIYVIREQISMLASIYSQYLKAGGTRSFYDWFLDPIECKGIIERLKYDKNIEMYYEIFGQENVLVLLYEELRSDRSTFLKKIYVFIGCKDISCIPLHEKRNVNSSLTTWGAVLSRILQSFFRNSYHNYKSTFLFFDHLIYTLSSKKFLAKRDLLTRSYVIPQYGTIDRKQRILFSINMAISEKIAKCMEYIRIGHKLSVPNNIQKQINPLFAKSNRILKEKYHLEVDKYHWTLR